MYKFGPAGAENYKNKTAGLPFGAKRRPASYFYNFGHCGAEFIISSKFWKRLETTSQKFVTYCARFSTSAIVKIITKFITSALKTGKFFFLPYKARFSTFAIIKIIKKFFFALKILKGKFYKFMKNLIFRYVFGRSISI